MECGGRQTNMPISRVGVAVCKWLYQTVHDVQAISTFQYILPLMVRFYFHSTMFALIFMLCQPELFRFAEGTEARVCSRRVALI